MNEINYQEKFVNFQAITENHDPDVAMRYLQEANWDENEASKNYFKNINKNNQHLPNSGVSNNVERDFYQQNLISNSRNPVRTNSEQINNINPSNRIMSVNSNNSRQTRQNGGLLKSIKALFCCGQTREEEDENTLVFSLFDHLPGISADLKEFSSKIREKIGIFIIYQEKNREFNNFIEKIKNLDHITDVLKENYTIYPVVADSEEHKRINFLLGIKADEVVIPSMIFVSHQFSNNEHFTRHSVVETILGLVSTEIFYENLVKCVENVHLLKNQNSSTHSNSNINNSNKTLNQPKMNALQPPDSHAAIIQEQKDELNNLMREEEERKRRQIEEERKIEREKEDRKRLEMEKEELRKNKKNSLPEEPLEGIKEATLIVFRYSDGTGRSQRRFLKTEKISVLYDFVDTLGDIFIESDKYDLIQTFPMKVYHDKDKTLEEEGLYPNAVLQIREI